MPSPDPALLEIERKLDGEHLALDGGRSRPLSHARTFTASGGCARKARSVRAGRRSSTSSIVTSTRRTCASRAAPSVRLQPTNSRNLQRVFRMTPDQVFAKAVETGTNFNQIHIVGGHDPRQLSLDYWLPLMRRFKAAMPHVQLSLFTAAEIEYMAKRHQALISSDRFGAQGSRPRQRQRRRRGDIR